MNFDEQMKQLQRESQKQSIQPGLYIQNPIQVQTPKVYPWAPTTVVQKGGVSTLSKLSQIDVDSELMNLNRKLSKDPLKMFQGEDTEAIPKSHLKDGLFHQENTILSNPPMYLREHTVNRWEELPINPQENSIEPFLRNGIDTYLDLIDNSKC